MHRSIFYLSSALWAAATTVAPAPYLSYGSQVNWTSVERSTHFDSPRRALWRAPGKVPKNPAEESKFYPPHFRPESTRLTADTITEGVSGLGTVPVADPDAFTPPSAGLKKMTYLSRPGLLALWHRLVGRRDGRLQSSDSGSPDETTRASAGPHRAARSRLVPLPSPSLPLQAAALR